MTERPLDVRDRYAGRTEAVATRKAQLDGYVVRVSQRDRENYVEAGGMRRCRRDRVNFYIRDGFVRGAEIG